MTPAGMADTGVADSGVADTGMADTGMADSGVADSGWEAVLTAMETGLEVYPPLVLPSLPAGLGPVPAALLDRARRTLRRMAEVEEALERHRGEVGQELSALGGARTAAAGTARPVPHFLDTRA